MGKDKASDKYIHLEDTFIQSDA